MKLMKRFWVNQSFVAVDRRSGARVLCQTNPPLPCPAATEEEAKFHYQRAVVMQYDAMGMSVPGFFGSADIIEAGEAEYA